MLFPKSAKSWYWISLVVVFLSLFFVALGGYFALESYDFLHRAEKTKATIVELVTRHGDNGTTYAPVYIYKDSKGKSHKIYSSMSTYPPLGEVGDEIDIYYDPVNPKDARINTFFCIWGFAAICGGIGALYVLIFGGVAIYAAGRMKRENKTGGLDDSGIIGH